jgi:hypothetical protein
MGGLRDLHSDLSFGVNTTPIYFGVRPAGRAMSIPSRVSYYGYFLQVMMMAGGILMIIWNAHRYPVWLMFTLGLLSVLGGAIALFFLVTTFDAATKDYDMLILAGLRYLGTSAASLFLILLPALPWWVALCIVAIFLWQYRDYSPSPIIDYWRDH